MKKTVAFLAALVMTGSLIAGGCSPKESKEESSESTQETTETTEASESSENKAITLLNGKVEVDEQMQMLAELYKEETGEEIKIISTGIDKPASDTLQEMKENDEVPDIFFCEPGDFKAWDGEICDLSDEEWNSTTQMAYKNGDEQVVGFPYMVEGCGLSYNAQMLKKAGINPKELTGPQSYREAFEKLDGMKNELGLKAVVAYATNTKDLSWSTGTHLFGQYLDAGLDKTDTTYIDELNNGGKTEAKRMSDFADFIGLLQEYSDPELLTEGTYDDQVRGFANKEYAFITQGSWIGTLLTGKFSSEYLGKKQFKCGVAPFAFEEGIDKVLVGPTSYWAVNKNGNVDKAKLFLLWCSMEDAQQILVDEAGFISPFDNCPFESVDPFARSITKLVQSENYSSFHTFFKKSGLEDELAVAFASYARGDFEDSSAFAEELSRVCRLYYE